jgi:hypothetical protein
VFVRYRRVNEEDGWKDVDVKQSKMSFGSFATVQHLYNSLLEKWHLRGINSKYLILRIFDKDFEEYVDIEENFALVSLENLAKYELIHRISNDKELKNNNVLIENAQKLNELSNNNDLGSIIKEIQEQQNFNGDNLMDVFVRNANFLLRANQQNLDEKPNEGHINSSLYSLLNGNSFFDSLIGHSFTSDVNEEESVSFYGII